MNTHETHPYIEQDQFAEPISEHITPKCRLCQIEEGELISPCMCKGGLEHVHPICLAQQIESRRIMNVAEVHGVYNSRCSFCKFHIEFVISEEHFKLSPEGISLALKSLNEDSAASLGLNVSLAILVLTIMTVTIMGQLKAGSEGYWGLNCKVVFLELFLAFLFCFLLQNIFSAFPFKTKKPIPMACLTV